MLPPIVLDVEASGFGRGSYPIEVGFVEAKGAAFCSLILPPAEWQHWDEGAEVLHGISRSLLQSRGKSPAWVAAELNRRLHGQTVYCDGWANDYSWLALLYDEAGLQPAFRLEDLRTLLSEDEAQRWHQITGQVRSEQRLARHRASSDARVLQLALMRVKGSPALA